MSYKFYILLILVVATPLSSCSKLNRLFNKKDDASSHGTASTAPEQPALNTVDVADTLSLTDLEYTGPSPKAIRLGPNVNTVYSDFAPFRFADRLYFSSLFLGEKEPVSRIFSSVKTGAINQWSENSKEPGINTTHATFSGNGQRVYFTFCEDKPEEGGQVCEIYTRERAYEGYWLPYKRLPNSINLQGSTTTQPSFGYNQSLKKDVLYFASNRPGGKGGMDIWCCPIERNGTYGKPFPMPFNTDADEVTPFFHQPGQVLYFSSNSTSGGKGFDIFKAANYGTFAGESLWTTPEKLDAPINSPYDDLYFSCHTASGMAYFCSNRPGCLFPTDCVGYDIFEVEMPTELNVEVFSALDKGELKGATIQLTETGSGQKVPLTVTTNAERIFNVEFGKKYLLEVEGEGFYDDVIVVEPIPKDVFSQIVKKVYLRPKSKVVVETYSALDSLPIGGVSFRYSSKRDSFPLIYQNTETATEYSFQYGFGDDPKLEASKTGYKTAVITLESPIVGPSVVVHHRVYLQPFGSLPLALYFDNDQPRWVQPMDMDTKLTYEQTYSQYLERKQVFVEKYAEGLAQEAFEAARNQVLYFFDNEVAVSLSQLNDLCAQIEFYLKKGYHLEMVTEGEASPLASMDYNNRLSARRVSSLRNHLKAWRNGALKSYIYSGKLTVSSMLITTGQDDNSIAPLIDRRQMEFSPEVSRLRKVVIRDIRIQVPKV